MTARELALAGTTLSPRDPSFPVPTDDDCRGGQHEVAADPRERRARLDLEDAAYDAGWLVHAGKVSPDETLRGLRRMAARLGLADDGWAGSLINWRHCAGNREESGKQNLGVGSFCFSRNNKETRS